MSDSASHVRIFTMSDEDLELLITLDDPEGPPEEDTFHHLSGENTYDSMASALHKNP